MQVVRSVLSLNRRKMKRVALFVLALVVVALGDEEESIEKIAKRFETDAQTVQACLSEAETNIEEMHDMKMKWKQIKDEDDIDEETKQAFKKYNSFFACILEKKDLMKDSKLVLDKVIEALEKDKDMPQPINKEAITECVTSLNEDSEMAREDRAFGLMVCVIGSQDDGDRSEDNEVVRGDRTFGLMVA